MVAGAAATAWQLSDPPTEQTISVRLDRAPDGTDSVRVVCKSTEHESHAGMQAKVKDPSLSYRFVGRDGKYECELALLERSGETLWSDVRSVNLNGTPVTLPVRVATPGN